MSTECKVVYSCNTYMAGPVAGVRATCTHGADAAARALGRKLFGDDFAEALLSGRAGTAAFYRLTTKSDGDSNAE